MLYVSEGQFASLCQIVWICYTTVSTTHEEHLVDFVTGQNLVGIGAAVSVLHMF